MNEKDDTQNPNGSQNPGGNSPERWMKIAQSEALAEGSSLEVLVDQQILAIFREDGILYALDGMCAHQGGPLAEGTVQNDCVTCPWHGWQYELKTGIQTINRQPLQTTYPIREIEGRIEVFLSLRQAPD